MNVAAETTFLNSLANTYDGFFHRSKTLMAEVKGHKVKMRSVEDVFVSFGSLSHFSFGQWKDKYRQRFNVKPSMFLMDCLRCLEFQMARQNLDGILAINEEAWQLYAKFLVHAGALKRFSLEDQKAFFLIEGMCKSNNYKDEQK